MKNIQEFNLMGLRRGTLKCSTLKLHVKEFASGILGGDVARDSLPTYKRVHLHWWCRQWGPWHKEGIFAALLQCHKSLFLNSDGIEKKKPTLFLCMCKIQVGVKHPILSCFSFHCSFPLKHPRDRCYMLWQMRFLFFPLPCKISPLWHFLPM